MFPSLRQKLWSRHYPKKFLSIAKNYWTSLPIFIAKESYVLITSTMLLLNWLIRNLFKSLNMYHIAGLIKLKVFFPTIEDLMAFYVSQEPTNAKVVNMLHAEITNDAEREAFNYLKKYVRGLEKSKLCSFLKFVTSSDIIVTNTIQVSFTAITSAARRSICHSCGCTLELPSTYSNFCELRQKFSGILSADNWEMDIV